MPEICRFYGIIIGIFYADHNPPYFHAKYGEHKAAIEIENFAVLEGYLPTRALGLVMEWASRHQNELLTDWEAAKKNQPLRPIEPLK